MANTLKSYARPLLILGTILFGAGLTYLIMYFVVGPPAAPAAKPSTTVEIIPIKVPNPNGGADSLQKVVGDFAFTTQSGKPLKRAELRGKIWVADVFFSTCAGICPKLSSGMQRIYQAFKGDPEVRLVSFTVDPEYDSIPVLRDYAAQYGAADDQWAFVTGSKADLYRVETEEFFFSHTEDEDKTVKFVHDGKLRLVDKEGRFRGKFYDGLDSADVDAVIADIKRLKSEYAEPQK
jgi:protein SCO1